MEKSGINNVFTSDFTISQCMALKNFKWCEPEGEKMLLLAIEVNNEDVYLLIHFQKCHS